MIVQPRKSYITLIKIFIKTGFGLILSIFIEIVYSNRAQINHSFRLLGFCSFLVGGIFIIFGGLRLFFGPAYLEVLTDENGELLLSLEKEFLCGFGKSGEDLLAGLLILLISLDLMTSNLFLLD